MRLLILSLAIGLASLALMAMAVTTAEHVIGGYAVVQLLDSCIVVHRLGGYPSWSVPLAFPCLAVAAIPLAIWTTRIVRRTSRPQGFDVFSEQKSSNA